MISMMCPKALLSVGERGLLLVVWATGSGVLVEARFEMTVAGGVSVRDDTVGPSIDAFVDFLLGRILTGVGTDEVDEGLSSVTSSTTSSTSGRLSSSRDRRQRHC